MALAESSGHMDAPRIYAGDAIMYRDDDLIRKLMLDFEASDDWQLVRSRVAIEGVDPRAIHYHLKLLTDSGLLEESSKIGGVFRMTSAGHDFCCAARHDDIWQKMREASRALSGVGLGIMKDVGTGYLRAKLIEMGVPLG